MFAFKKALIPFTAKSLNFTKVQGFGGVHTLSVTGQGFKDGNTSVKIDGGKTTEEIHSPLEILLAALIACENKTIRAIAMQSKLEINEISFVKCQATYDTKGFFGKGEQKDNKFEKVEVEAVFDAKLTPQQLSDLEKEVRRRCPVLNTLTLAGIPVESKYRLI